jgi:hypothetical protein
MKLRLTFARATVALIAAATSVIAAASDKDEFEQRAEKIRQGPASAPSENETGFGKGLKCMDGLFRAYGVRHVTVVIDQIPDATKKINAGARDMFMSATSQMTRTSHAIRLVPIIESRVFTESKRQQVVADADFAIQGSISQFDDSMLQKQRDGAVCIWKVCIGAADSDKISGLGLDLNLVETVGLSLVPGASVRNAVLLRKHGNGYDGEMTLKNFAIEYNFTLSSNDGNGQALRTLIELGAIELYGRMLKLPYWSCLGADQQDPAVSSEIDDWWEEMAADPRDRGRLMSYLQYQMKVQGVYDGQINGQPTPRLLRAVRAYEVALGMPDDLNLDAHFLHKYLAADQSEVRKVAVIKLAEINQKEGPLPPEPIAQAAPQGQPASPGTSVAQNGPAGQGTAVPQGTPVAQNAPAGQGAPAGQSASVAQAAPIAQTQTAPAKQGAPVASATTPAPTLAQAAVPALSSASVAAVRNSATVTQPAASPSTAAAQPAAAPSVAAVQPAAPPSTAGVKPSVAPSMAAQSAGVAGMTPAVYHPASIPIEGSRPANSGAYRAGEPFFVGVISPRDGYLYCFVLDDHKQISQFYPAPAESSVRLSGGTLKVLNSESPLVASRPGHRQQVACFSSPKDLGQQPLDAASIAGGLEGLKTRFAIAVSGAYAMGVFDVKVQ